ncbi:MAG: hypothetical protein KF901_20635 [Myxococcales bacterium]|nr:hypothetical protein [Myxococcales bacterium]
MNRREALRLASLLREENVRAMAEMKIPRHPKPYYLSYLVRHDEEHRIEAKYGALTMDLTEVRRSCYADVRVGSYRRDQVRAGGFKDNLTDLESNELVRLPISGSPDGLRFALWRLTEAKYREACDDFLHRIAVELNFRDEHAALPSFERREAIEEVHWRKLPEFDRDAAEAFVLRASASLKSLPCVRDSHVRISAINAIRIFVSSEGTTLVQAIPYRVVELHLWYLSPEGHAFPQTETWFVTDEAELPDLNTVKQTAKRLHARAESLAKAPVLRAFSGPVLLSPKAAGLMIHEALGHRLEGNRLLAEGEGQTFRDAVGETIILPGLSVRDDPTLTSFEGKSLTGAFAFDDEGVPAQPAELIREGVLTGFLTSRTPIGKKHRSNGHGRAAYHQRPISRMGVTIAEATHGLDDEALWQAFLEEIRSQGAPYGIWIIDAFGGETSTESYDFQAFLGEIDLAARVFPDGRYELVRGVDFVGTPLNAIGGIVAAGARREVDNSWCGAESGYVPVTTISPALLVDELELQAKPQRPMTPYAYPMPWK